MAKKKVMARAETPGLGSPGDRGSNPPRSIPSSSTSGTNNTSSTGYADSVRYPFQVEALTSDNGHGALPALYHAFSNETETVHDPVEDVQMFVANELSLGYVGEIDRHLWYAGSKRPAMQLHWQIALGREIVAVDRMELHLLWDNSGRLFVKPIPLFLLDSSFWKTYLMGTSICAGLKESCTLNHVARSVAMGYLYTYACLLSSETDFHIANEKRLLPRGDDDALIISWDIWKKLARDILKSYDLRQIHPRFLRAELRLSRINSIHRFTRMPPFYPYLGGWYSYRGFGRDNFAWMATAAIFVVLVLTAMQVGLATDGLQGDATFQRASFGFALFAILGPMCVSTLMSMGALFNLVNDLPRLLLDGRGGNRNLARPPVTV